MFKKHDSLSLFNFIFQLCFFFFLFFCDASMDLQADESSNSISEKKLHPSKVKVGFFQFEGYHQINEFKERNGYGYDYLQKLSIYAPLSFEYIGYDKSWSEMLDLLEKGEIDLLTSAQKTKEREEKFDFSNNPIGISSAILTVKEGNTKYLQGDYKNWNGIRVGMLRQNSRNQAFDRYAKKMGFTYQAVYFPNMEKMLHALHHENSIDCIISSNLRLTKGEWIYDVFEPSPFYIIVKKGNRALLDIINYAIIEQKLQYPGLQEELWAKYYSSNLSGMIVFNTNEMRFIHNVNKNNLVFKAVLNPDRIPFSFFSENQYHGIIQDIVEAVKLRSQIPIEIIKTPTRKEYEIALKRNDVMIHLDALQNFSLAEEQGYKLTAPYINISISRLRKKHHIGPLKCLAAVKNSKILQTSPIKSVKHEKVIFFDNVDEAVKAVQAGVADVTYLYTRTAEYYEAQDDSNLLIHEVMNGYTSKFCIAVRQDAPYELGSILNKAVNSINNNDLLRVLSRYDILANQEFSFTRLFYSSPLLFLGIPFALLILGLFILIYILFLRRKQWRYLKITEQLPLRCFIVDKNEKILYISSGDVETPYQQGQIQYLKDLPYQSLIEDIRKRINLVFQEGTSIPFDFELEGKKRTAILSKLPNTVFNKDAVFWISQDTSQLQSAKEDALKLAEELHLCLNSIADSVIIVDEKMQITRVNPSATRMIGIPGEQIIGKSLSQVLTFQDTQTLQLTQITFDEVINGTVTDPHYISNIDLIKNNGERLHVDNAISTIKNKDGVIIGVVLVIHDLTHEIQARVDLQKALKEATVANKAKSMFLSTMSHEIRTPLNSVIAYADLLQYECTKEERHDYLTAIKVSSNALMNLINDILDLSKIDAGMIKISLDLVDIKEIFDELKFIFMQQINEKKLNFAIQYDAQLPKIRIDRARINQILLNLLGNAVKFTESGEITLFISFDIQDQHTGTLHIGVKDTGCGIHEEFLKNLFAPFSQERDNINNKKYIRGTGLGLAISKRLAEAMNGTISCHSQPGIGSQFTLVLNHVEYKIESTPQENKDTITQKLSIKNVLLIDDHFPNLQILKRLMGKNDLNIQTATSGNEALQFLLQKRFDWILTDLRMPEMDGFELASKIRDLPNNKDSLIVAITADRYIVESYALHHFDAIIFKPLSSSKIKILIKKLNSVSCHQKGPFLLNEMTNPIQDL